MFQLIMQSIKLRENVPLSGKFNIADYARTYLWRDLAVWSKIYLTSIHGDPVYQEAVFEKLYSIPRSFGSVIALIFGNHASEQYVNLLSQHLALLRELISAMTRGDQNAVTETSARLYQNADARVAFLCQINRFWSSSVWQSFLYYYLELTFQGINTFLIKDYAINIKTYDRLMYHTAEMGDYFSDGLLKYMFNDGAVVKPQT